MGTAIYVRLSEDKTGEAAGVERQETEARALAQSRGWEVTRVYADNDLSATTGVARPAFEALLRDRPSRVVVYHVDRLIRLSSDLERVIALGVNVHAVHSGHVDLSNPAGRAVARTITAWSTYEGEQKAVRQRSSNRQRAERGISVWSRRPYGFDRAGREVFVVEHEADVIRDMAARVLAGDTLASIVRGLNDKGILNSEGRPWNLTTAKRTLLSPRLAGRLAYNGTVYPAAHPAILDEDVADRLSARLTDPRRRTATSTRTKHLLSGLAICGRCGTKMFATSNTSGTTGQTNLVLRCTECYLTRQMRQTEDFVRAVITKRLSLPDVADLLVSTEDVTDLREQIASLRERRDALTVLLAQGSISPAVAREQIDGLNASLRPLESRLDALTGESPLKGIADAPDPVAAFLAASLARQRTVVSALLRVTVLPVGKGRRWSTEGIKIEGA